MERKKNEIDKKNIGKIKIIAIHHILKNLILVIVILIMKNYSIIKKIILSIKATINKNI